MKSEADWLSFNTRCVGLVAHRATLKGAKSQRVFGFDIRRRAEFTQLVVDQEYDK